MSQTSIPGHEYLAFLSDPEYWNQTEQQEIYAEGVVLLVDGHRFEQNELTPTTISADSEVVIVAGDVFQFMTPLHSLEQHFDSWREANVPQPAPR
jgi:hypothetical protein